MRHRTLVLLAAVLAGAGLSGTPGSSARADETKQEKEKTGLTADFSKYDSNRDGFLSLQEFKDKDGNEQAFTEADSDRDGRLNPDEYAKARATDQRMKIGDFIDDAWITTKIKALLLKEEGFNTLNIKVDTKDGVVRLSGQVEKSGQLARAVDIASNVEGVKSVQTDFLLKK